MYSALCFLWHIYLFVEWQWWWDDDDAGDDDDDGDAGDDDDDGDAAGDGDGDVLVMCRARRLMTTMTA